MQAENEEVSRKRDFSDYFGFFLIHFLFTTEPLSHREIRNMILEI